MQANQLVESVTTVFTTPAGIENTLGLRFVMGIVISLVVGAVIIGGIRRISVISAKIVPVMVTCYMLLVFVILCLNFDKLPGVLASIFQSAFSLEAGIGGILGTALTGARRAAYVNEAGVGTASMMHGASRNDNPAGSHDWTGHRLGACLYIDGLPYSYSWKLCVGRRHKRPLYCFEFF